MKSFFNKPAWATKTDDSGTEFYRRSGQTYNDIVAANREAHRKQKLASEFAESSSSPALEGSRKTKRRKSDEHAEGSETEDEECQTASTAKPVKESKPKEHRKRSTASPGNEQSRSNNHEQKEDSHRPTTIPRPVYIDLESTESPSDQSNTPSSHRISNDSPTKAQPIITLDSQERERRERLLSKYLNSESKPQPAQPSPTPPPPTDDPRVHILITSEIPNTKPLIVQRKVSQALKDARLAWCKRQEFTEQETSSIYLTWKGSRLFDVTTCKRLDLSSEKKSFLDLDDDLDEKETELRIHMEAETDDPALMNRRGPTPGAGEGSPAPPTATDEQEVEPMKLLLKCPGFTDFRVKAKPTTLVSKVAAAFREKQSIPEDKIVHLVFDGDRLAPDSCLGDHDIANLDMLEVLLK